jgi:hypothetical protein
MQLPMHMDRKMNDQEAVHILFDSFKARLLESLA